MQQHESSFKWPCATWAIGFSPLVLLFAFVTLAIHVRMGLGHWPEPMIENYSTSAFDTHERIVEWILLFTLFLALPLWAIFLCIPSLRLSFQTHLNQAGVYAIGWGLILIYCLVDPGSFIEWFMD